MLRLLALRASIAVWKRSLVISKKLRVRTWIALAAIHASLAIGLFWAYQARTVPESAIPRVYHAQVQPAPLPDLLASDGYHCTAYAWGGINSWWILGSESPIISQVEARMPVAGDTFNVSANGTGFESHVAIVVLASPGDPITLPKLPNFARPIIVVQAPSTDQPYLFQSVERWRIFICGVIATLAALIYLFFAWEKRKREKAQAVLTALQIEKIQVEIALLRQQWEKAEREARESGIIVSG